MNEDDKRERPVAGDMADAAGRDTPFLQRWSARKTRARSAAEQQPVAEHPPAATEPAAAVAAEARPELTDADMPPLEAIDATTDVSGFFSPKVSAELRRLALRKLFQLPVYNIRDGLDDYDDDYTKFEPLGDTITSDMKYMQQVAERKRLEKLAEQEALAAEQQALHMQSADPPPPAPAQNHLPEPNPAAGTPENTESDDTAEDEHTPAITADRPPHQHQDTPT
jgi:hypothetical protein